MAISQIMWKIFIKYSWNICKALPNFADKNMAISRAYGVLKEDEGLRF